LRFDAQKKCVFSSCLEAKMRTALRAILAGASALLAISAATPAVARDGQARSFTLQFPDGGVERIQYVGDVPLQVTLAPAPFLPIPLTVEPELDWQPSLAALERISAVLDQQAALMLRHETELPDLARVTVAGLPAGTSGLAVVSTYSSDGACTRSTQVTYAGGGAKPRTVSQVSGNCGPESVDQIPEQLSAPSRFRGSPTGPGTIQVKASGKQPYAALVQKAAWQH
jgi:hypothetical protein